MVSPIFKGGNSFNIVSCTSTFKGGGHYKSSQIKMNIVLFITQTFFLYSFCCYEICFLLAENPYIGLNHERGKCWPIGSSKFPQFFSFDFLMSLIKEANPIVIDDTEAPECSICLDDSQTEPSVFLLCGHVFHDHCLMMWIIGHPSCPFCR